MAIEVSIRRPEAPRLPLGLSRLAAIPAGFALAGVVAVSFVARFLAALLHATPSYFADEYIYSSIARSLADSGRPLVRGASAHFPSLLEPILAAPFWLSGDPALAYRLTQSENALAMALAAIPAYLLARKLGLGAGLGLAAAALTVASPDLFFAAFILADAIAYPLVLGAVYAGVCVLARPTRRGQLAFVAFSGLAAFARIQYIVLPVVFLAAALVVERGRIRPLVSRFRLTLGLFALPVAVLIALGPSRTLGYYSTVGDAGVRPGAFLRWIATDGMLLAYSAGWVLIPGALIGLAYALGRPRSAEERAFGALAAALSAVVFLEAGLYAANVNGSGRFQERYFMTLIPLVFPAFALYLRRGRPARLALSLLAVGLLAVAARIPLSGYTISDHKQDSPFLFAVFRLERWIGVENGSLAVAVIAALCSLLAVGIAFRARLAPLALALTLVLSSAVSYGAVDFDRLVTDSVRAGYLPPDARWIDRAGLKDVILLQTAGTPHARAHEQLFWNQTLTDVRFLGRASPIDAFPAKRVRIATDGRILDAGRTLRAPLAISNYAASITLNGAVRVASGAAYELWRPAGTPRFSVFMGGRYLDGWLSPAGQVTVWPDASGRVRGTLRLVLSLPEATEPTHLRFNGPGVARDVMIAPGGRRTLFFEPRARGPWTVRFRTRRPGYLDGRPVSVQAGVPTFSRAG